MFCRNGAHDLGVVLRGLDGPLPALPKQKIRPVNDNVSDMKRRNDTLTSSWHILLLKIYKGRKRTTHGSLTALQEILVDRDIDSVLRNNQFCPLMSLMRTLRRVFDQSICDCLIKASQPKW